MLCLFLIFFLFIRVEQVWLQAIIRVLLVPVIAGISYEIIRFAGNSDNKVVVAISKPGFALQKLTTREPDDAMIEVAIASVEAVYDWKPFVEQIRTENAGAEWLAAENAIKAEEAAKKAEEQKAIAAQAAEEKKIAAKQEAARKAAEKAAQAEAKRVKAAEEAAAKEAERAAKAEAERIAAEKAAQEAEERRKALEVNLDALDKVLTVTEPEKELEFKDPYEDRKLNVIPVEEEDDEILKALDRYFVMDEEDDT